MDGLIGIGEAARLLMRTTKTLRRWESRGYASNGMSFSALLRDEVTGERYFSRERILKIRAAMLKPA
jgi:DNA-binding transcriptional MerR regulator